MFGQCHLTVLILEPFGLGLTLTRDVIQDVRWQRFRSTIRISLLIVDNDAFWDMLPVRSGKDRVLGETLR